MAGPHAMLLLDWEGLETHNAALVGMEGTVREDVFDMPERTDALAERARRWTSLQDPKGPGSTTGEASTSGTTRWCAADRLAIKSNSREATDAELTRGGVTSRRYLKHLMRLSKKLQKPARGGKQRKYEWLDWDETSVVTATTERCARRAVGAMLDAVEEVWIGRARRVFVACRPPGHHNGCNEALEVAEENAFRYASHGGCVLNETAVAIHHLRDFNTHRPRRTDAIHAHKPESAAMDHATLGADEAPRPEAIVDHLYLGGMVVKAVVLDIDVHFGDGTAWIFYSDANVLTVSLHYDQTDGGCFPYLKGKPVERGEGQGRGTTINLPMQPGMGDLHAWRLLERCAFPRIKSFCPDIIFVAFGTDGMAGDPSDAKIEYSSALFANCTRWCTETCERVVCSLQGGYQAEPMADAVEETLKVLTEDNYGCPPLQGELLEPTVDGETFRSYVEKVERELVAENEWWSYARSFDYEALEATQDEEDELSLAGESNDRCDKTNNNPPTRNDDERNTADKNGAIDAYSDVC